MSQQKMNRVIPFSLLVFFTSASMAQQQGNAAGVAFGPGYAFPSLEVRALHDDNLLSQPTNELETFGWGISPGVVYEISDNIRRFTADWLLDAGYYDDSGIDDYVDNFLNAQFEYRPTDRTFGSIRAGYKDTHDPRGTGRSEGTGAAQVVPDEWHSFDVEGNIGYGAQSAQARMEGTVGYVTKTYDNNLAATIFRDRDDVYGSGRFFYRVGPKTSLLAEGRIADFEYDQTAFGTASLNSTVYKLFGGLTWEATAKTTGAIRIGYMEKNFDAQRRRIDGDSLAWEVGITWEPRTYSTVLFQTARNFEETNGTGDFIQKDSFNVSWLHAWTERVRSNAYFNYSIDSYEPTTREDDLIYIGLSVDYTLQRWLTLTGGYRFEERDSNTNLFDYDRNIYTLSIRLTL